MLLKFLLDCKFIHLRRIFCCYLSKLSSDEKSHCIYRPTTGGAAPVAAASEVAK